MGASEERGVVVVGAGAAGLWAAARLAEGGQRPLLLEKTARVGTKILASGGTRCNLTTTLDADSAAALFGQRGERFLRRAFRALTPEDVRARFRELGVETVEAPLEKVFPASDRARDVRDALLAWIERSGVELRCEAGVRTLTATPGGYRLQLLDGNVIETPKLLLAPGGKSYPRTGTTGDGYGWLTELELPLVDPTPALVPLTSPETWVHELAGIDLQASELALVSPEGKALGRRRRPLVFTHRGLSGPGAMDLSLPVGREERSAAQSGRPPRPHRLRIDLQPTLDREALRARLIEGSGRPGAPTLVRSGDVLGPQPLPRRLVRAVLEQAGLDPGTRVNALAKAQRHALVEALKGLEIPVNGTRGFEQAEVTAGGLELGAVNPGTMEVRERPGLFVIGELLDVQGPIGGLNFQAAFATAELAARALA